MICACSVNIPLKHTGWIPCFKLYPEVTSFSHPISPLYQIPVKLLSNPCQSSIKPAEAYCQLLRLSFI